MAVNANYETMKRRGFYCPDKLFTQLQAHADKSGTQVAEHIRAAIVKYLEEQKKPR